jgi:hypothetical protein
MILRALVLGVCLRALSASMVPTQYPLEGKDGRGQLNRLRPGAYHYYFDMNGAQRIVFSEADVKSKAGVPNCYDVLTPAFVVFQYYADLLNNYNQNDRRNLPLEPDDGQLEIYEMAQCQPGTAGCLGCSASDSAVLTTVKVRSWGYEGTGFANDIYDVKYQTQCLLYVFSDCSVGTCKDGEYASDYLDINATTGFIMNRIQCLPCMPGTWLTCYDSDTCSYEVPSRGDKQFDGGQHIYSLDSPPVGRCFPCERASGKAHYPSDPARVSRIAMAEDDSRFYCPGNLNGNDGVPRMCASPRVTSPNRGACVCADGYYENALKACVPCPTGSMCVGGNRVVCPDHTYQDEIMQVDCKPCTEDRTATGAPTIECFGAQLLQQCKRGANNREPPCVGCNMCNKAYLPNAQGMVDCYMPI